MHRTRQGFSLIELMVVLVTVLVLAAMLLPAMSIVRHQANSTHCLSNLRQIGLGMMVYAQDHHGCLPPGQAPPPDRDILHLPYWGIWWGFIESYMPVKEGAPLWWCPSSCFSLSEIRAAGTSGFQASYGMVDRAFGGQAWYAHQISVVPQPDRSILMADHFGVNSVGTMDYMPFTDWYGPTWVISGPRRPGFGGWLPRASHGNSGYDPTKGRIGTLFFSGRVESLRWQDSYNPASNIGPPNQWWAKY